MNLMMDLLNKVRALHRLSEERYPRKWLGKSSVTSKYSADHLQVYLLKDLSILENMRLKPLLIRLGNE